MRIGNLDSANQSIIVAEIGNNHEGDCGLAREMIEAAADSGVDAVKFQCFKTENYVARVDRVRFALLEKFRLSFDQFSQLADHCQKNGVEFFATPFDLESAEFLNTIQRLFKISSGDNTFFPLLKQVFGYEKPVIVSTGLANLSEIEAVERLHKTCGGASLALLHCVSAYPVPVDQANLSAITSLAEHFPAIEIGYSDHVIGNKACLVARALGARIIEKHFTIDKNLSEFRDHQLSADPVEMKELVSGIREYETLMGLGAIGLVAAEENIMPSVRRSIAASENISKGQAIQSHQLKWIRPGSGLSVGEENRVVGRVTRRDILEGEILSLDDFE